MLNAVEKDLIRLERDMEASIERVALADGVMGSRRRDEQNQQKREMKQYQQHMAMLVALQAKEALMTQAGEAHKQLQLRQLQERHQEELRQL